VKEMNVLATINGLFPSLTKSEQKVAQYVEVNADEVVHLSIGDLSQKAGVADTTVIRFCRKLKFRGYQDFKVALTRDLAISQERVKAANDGETYPVVAEYLDYLKQANAQIDLTNVDQAAKMIDQAGRVFLLAAGFSGIVGRYFRERMKRLGKVVVFDGDTHLQTIDLASIQPHDLVIAISQTGNTVDVVRNIQLAGKLKAPVISITNYLDSEISSMSDLTLVAPPGHGKDSSELPPVMGQLVIIDLICQHLRDQNPERAKEMRDRINSVLIEGL
jgi:DNA-binding MurR/RpiR family transcriptional regulator